MKIEELIKSQIQRIDKNAEVILFGSRAKGDFLILLEKEANEKIKRTIRDVIFEIELKTDEIISSIIKNKIKWNGKNIR